MSVSTPQSEPYFFGAVDKHPKGTGYTGQYPSWMFDQLIDDLKESISNDERALADKVLEGEQLARTRTRLALSKERMEAIEQGRPVNIDKDRFNKMANELGDKIKESLFSADDMKRGMVEAHEEARRMKTPCIKLSPEEAGVAHRMGIKFDHTERMVSRDQAGKMWKILRRALGEGSNIESLRRY